MATRLGVLEWFAEAIGEFAAEVGVEEVGVDLVGVAEVTLTWKCFGGEDGDSTLTMGGGDLDAKGPMDIGRCFDGMGCLGLSWATCSAL